MFTVKFGRPTLKRKHIIGKSKTHEGAWALMVEHLKKQGVQPYYYRSQKLKDNKTEQIDYGNHSEFFYIVKT